MSNMEQRMSFRLNEETKRKVMSRAAEIGIYSFSEVIRQGLELWLVRESVHKKLLREVDFGVEQAIDAMLQAGRE